MESQYNNVDTTLDIAGTWNGEAELCNGYVIILVYIKSSKRCTLKVRQSDNKSNYNFIETVEYLPITGEARYQIYRSSLYCYVEVINDSGEVIPDLIVRTHFLNIGRDSSIYYPTVVAGAVDVVNFPAVQPVSGSVSIANDVTVKGVNNNFEFFPTATNNTSSIYADGTKGTDVAGGWQYTNQITGKINWYCYSSAGLATDYKVSQLNSMYTVINQQSTLGLTLAQNPWIMIYTRMDSGTNSGSFFKSKLFFGANAHTDINGLKLLYTGSDPVHIHPEITGINRIQLLFISALSNDKQLADVQNETILAGSLQTTTNTSPVGAFNFTMEEFGVDWDKETVRLPIEFNKVKCDVSGTVAVSNVVAVSGSFSPTGTQDVKIVQGLGPTGTQDVKIVEGLGPTGTQDVKIVSTLPTGTNIIGKVITFENPSSVISLTNVSTIGQTIKNSPGSLFNLTVFNDGNAISYVKLYDVAVPTASDTPVITLPVLHDSALNTISIHNYQFSTAIGIRATANYIANDTTAPNGTTSITAFYNGIIP